MLSCFNLEELRLGHLDHHLVTIRACHREVFLEDLDKIFDLSRQGSVHMLVDSAAVLLRLDKCLLRTLLFRSTNLSIHEKFTRLCSLAGLLGKELLLLSFVFITLLS